MKKTQLINNFQLVMWTACSTADIMSSSIQRQMLVNNDFNKEQLTTMDDHQVRIQVIRVIFINSVEDNILAFCDTQEQFDKTEREMYTFLKEWDEL
jgi:hypothetical protein